MLNRLIISLIGICLSVAYGQEYTRYTTKEGLPSNNIYDITQDSLGFIWFNTNRGVVKFDGSKFKIFTIKDGLPNNDIWKLLVDNKNRIWFNSKSKYQGYIKDDSVYKFPSMHGKVMTPQFRNINNKIWLCEGASYYELLNDTFFDRSRVEFTKIIEKRARLRKKYLISTEELNQYYSHNKKLLFLSTYNSIIMAELDGSYSEKITLNEPLPIVTEKIMDEKSGILLDSCFYYLTQNGITFLNIYTKKTKSYDFQKLIGSKITRDAFCYLNNEQIHLCLPNHLFLLDNKYKITNVFHFPEFNKNIYSFLDKNNNIWLNNEDGVVLITETKAKSTNFLPNRKIQKIGLLNSKVIVGVSNDGFYELDYKKDTFIKNPTYKSGFNIYSIPRGYNQEKSYLCGDFHSYEITKNASKKLTFKDPERDVIYSSLKDFVKFNNKHYWINNGAFFQSDTLTYKVDFFIVKYGLLYIKKFKDSLYVGGGDGLFIYEKEKLNRLNKNNTLLETPITSMESDSNYLYIGTDGRGIYLHDKNNNTTHITSTDGLIVQRIIRDNNRLLLATQQGVKTVSLDMNDIGTSKITNSFYESDGLLQNNINDIFLEDSLLWVATDLGLSRIIINSSIFKKTIPITFDFKNDTVTYQYSSSNQISVNFHALDYVNQQYLTYEYRLLPSTKEWSSTNPGTINFSGLSSTLHTLEVRVTDQHNNQSIGKQHIQILPAWWQTICAKIGFVVSIGLALFLLVKYIQLTIRVSEHRKAERKTKLAGLELQALRSQMNPHFVHNSLNAIKYYIQRNEVELSEEYLVKFSKLIRLFFEFSRRENITLDEEIDLLTVYLHIEKLRFEEKLTYEIIVDHQLDIEDQLIPSMILQPIVENAVNHGLFHKKEKGKVTITIKSINSYSYYIIIEDDGIGINKAKKIYDASSENYQSKSSEVLQDRLELLKQNNMWDITYEIVDLSEKDMNQGTRVNLTFKQIL